jgi:hypothetical protein
MSIATFFATIKSLHLWDRLRGDSRFEEIVALGNAERCCVTNQVKPGRRETLSRFHWRS